MKEDFLSQKFTVETKAESKTANDSTIGSASDKAVPSENYRQTNNSTPKAASSQELFLNILIKNFSLGQTEGEKNANLIGAMAVVAGAVGVHDFYCGNQRNGILKIIFSAFPILAPISAIWAIIDICKIGCGTYKPKRDLPMAPAPWCKKAAIVATFVYFAVLTLILRPLVQFFL